MVQYRWDIKEGIYMLVWIRFPLYAEQVVVDLLFHILPAILTDSRSSQGKECLR